jgi:hypothetical protein
MATTSKGHIERLPSGSLRVKVYAGKDPVTGKERVLRETCPDEAEAAAACPTTNTARPDSLRLAQPCGSADEEVPARTILIAQAS